MRNRPTNCYTGRPSIIAAGFTPISTGVMLLPIMSQHKTLWASYLIDVKVHIDGRLASSNADVMLDSTLESEEALKGYAVHPEHVAVANGKVRPYTVQRSCLDFEV